MLKTNKTREAGIVYSTKPCPLEYHLLCESYERGQEFGWGVEAAFVDNTDSVTLPVLNYRQRWITQSPDRREKMKGYCATYGRIRIRKLFAYNTRL